MAKFKVTFVDEIEAETEEAAYDQVINYMREVVQSEDVTAFDFEEIE
jgi:hypothetical protein